MIGNNNQLYLISFSINGFNSPIKRHRLKGYIYKEDPAFCYIQETHIHDKDRHNLRVKAWEKIPCKWS
jgi:exonuclease III